MTSGSSQGLFIIVAVVIFGIFVVISYVLFRDNLKTGLATLFKDSISETEFVTKQYDTDPKAIIKDTHLQRGIRDTLNLSKGTKITEEHLGKLTSLSVHTQNKWDLPLSSGFKYYTHEVYIKSVKGLEKAENLTALGMDGNGVQNFEGIKTLTKLKSLNLNNNKALIDLKLFKELKDLETLLLGGNTLKNTEVINSFSKLRELHISYNDIENIDFLENNQTIKTLHVYSKNLKSIKAIETMPNLEVIYYSDTDFLEAFENPYNVKLVAK